VDVQPDFIDDTGLEERGREVTAAHHEDVLAGLLLERTHEPAGVGADELDALTGRLREGPREQVALDPVR